MKHCEPLIKALALVKAHVSAYTRSDGTFVAEHDDKRQAAQPKPAGRKPSLPNVPDFGGNHIFAGIAKRIHESAQAGDHEGVKGHVDLDDSAFRQDHPHVKALKDFQSAAHAYAKHKSEQKAKPAKVARPFKEGDHIHHGGKNELGTIRKVTRNEHGDHEYEVRHADGVDTWKHSEVERIKGL